MSRSTASSSSTSSKGREGAEMPARDGHYVTKRLQKELMALMTMNDQVVSAFPEGDNMFKWIGTIKGPPESVYEGLTYKLSMEFPAAYPYTAPIIKFTTPCFHPNVDVAGNICLDILKDKWSALYDVRTILLSIQSLLGEPNTSSPLNLVASDLWEDQVTYKKVLLEKYHNNGKTKTNEKR